MTLNWPITGADVANALNWSSDRAAEVEDQAAAAMSRVEEEVGPWHGQDLEHVVYTRRTVSVVKLPWPVASVTQVQVDGVTVEPLGVDRAAGLIYGSFGPGEIVVTAKARPAASVPDDVVLAARYLGAFWAKQEKVGNPSRTTRGTEPDTDVQQGFAMPRRVSEMLRPYIPAGGFA